jgi:hypothetical protein
MDVPTLNILPFYFLDWELSTSIIIAHAWEIGFNWSKQAINYGITTFASYSKAKQILHHGPYNF